MNRHGIFSLEFEFELLWYFSLVTKISLFRNKKDTFDKYGNFYNITLIYFSVILLKKN